MFRRYYNCNKYCKEESTYNPNENENYNTCENLKEYWDRSLGERDITMDQMKQFVAQGALVVDIRSPQEYNEGHLNGSINIPEYELHRSANRLIPNRNKTIIAYCGTGIRSKNAMRILQRMGYTNVYNLYKGTENY